MWRILRRIVVGASRGVLVGVVLAALWAEYATADSLHDRSAFRDLTKRGDVAMLIGIVFAGILVGLWGGLWASAPGTRSPLRWAGRVFVGGTLAGILIWATYCTFSPTCRYAVYGLFNGEPRHDGLCRSFWIRELKSTPSYRREKAAQVLDKLEQGAEPAMPALREALNDPDKDVRQAAAKALRHAPVGDPETIAALKPLLKDQDDSVRRAARGTLFGSVLKGQREALIAALDDPEPDIRMAAVTALSSAGRDALLDVPRLLLAVEKDDFSDMAQSVGAIGRAAPAEFTALVLDYLRQDQPSAIRRYRIADKVMTYTGQPFVPLLIGLLSDQDAAIRWNAAQYLGLLGIEAAEAKEALQKLERDPSEGVRKMAADALIKIDSAVFRRDQELTKDVPSTMDVHRAMLTSPDPTKRAQACRWTRTFYCAELTVTQLTPLLQDSDADVRLAAAFEVVRAGVPSEAAVAVGLSHTEWYVRRDMAEILGKLGPAARPAVPALVRLLSESNSQVKRAVAIALWQIEGTDNENVMRVIRKKDSSFLIDELAGLRPAPVNTIAAGLESEDSYTRQRAAQALGSLGPDAKATVPALLDLMARAGGSDRKELADAIDKIEPGTGTRTLLRLWWQECLSEAGLIGVAFAVVFLLVRWVGLVIFRAIRPASRQPAPKPASSGYNPFDDSRAAELGESDRPASHQS